MPPLHRFPSGPITPHGAYHILHDRIPQMGLTSYDGTVSFNIMGGLAIADKYAAPGRFEIKSLKGLVPPWKNIVQKGATQDGDSPITSLYDPADVQIMGRVTGKDPADCRRVYRYLIDSIDSQRAAELWFFTHELGRWWAPVLWESAPPDDIMGIRNKTQEVGLRLMAHNAFWQSYPSLDQFLFSYSGATDDFETDDPDDLGTGWTVSLSGAGTGGVHVEDGEARPTMSGVRTMVARKVGYTAPGDNVVGEIEIGTCGDWFFPLDAGDDIWVRMNNASTPGTSGVRLRISRHLLTLSSFTGGVETVIRQRLLIIPPLPGEKWRLVAGDPLDATNVRYFRVMRGAAVMMTVKESGTGSPIGSGNRSVGIGMHSSSTARPAGIRGFSAGENATAEQSKFLELYNCGDQDNWIDYTVFGPGTFRFWNGPNAGVNEYVEFGPILPNQVMQIRTDPRKRGVVDMTSVPATPQQAAQTQNALEQFFSFLTGALSGLLFGQINSQFGVATPQGNPYSLLKGRWSKKGSIPAKSPGRAAQPYHVKVSISGGNADSKILAAAVPLRRYPL
jgi:hypothetical protein